MIAAKILGNEHIELTIGNDPDTASDIEKMGARHIDCQVWNTIVCREKKVVSTPAYMMETTIGEVARGIEKLVGELLSLI